MERKGKYWKAARPMRLMVEGMEMPVIGYGKALSAIEVTV